MHSHADQQQSRFSDEELSTKESTAQSCSRLRLLLTKTCFKIALIVKLTPTPLSILYFFTIRALVVMFITTNKILFPACLGIYVIVSEILVIL